MIKLLNDTGPGTDPRGAPLITSLLLDTEPLTRDLWV